MATTNTHGKTMRSIVGLFLVLMVLFSVGCAQTQERTTKATAEWTEQAKTAFTGSTRLNMGPFAKQLVEFIGSVQFGMAGGEVVYTRPFLDGPEAMKWKTMMDQYKRNLAKIMAYSGRVVSLADSNLDGPGRAKALAEFIDIIRPLEPGDSKIEFKWTNEEIDAMVKAVGEQESLLAALQVAQPLVVEAARFLRDRVDEMKDYRVGVVAEIETRIHNEYAEMVAFDGLLKERQSLNYRHMTALLDHEETGDPGKLAPLLSDMTLKEIIGNKKRLDLKTADKIITELTLRLATINKLKQHMSADLEQYRKIDRELDALIDLSDEALQASKVGVIYWAQAHGRLAAGEVDPARFDFMGLAKIAFDLIL